MKIKITLLILLIGFVGGVLVLKDDADKSVVTNLHMQGEVQAESQNAGSRDVTDLGFSEPAHYSGSQIDEDDAPTSEMKKYSETEEQNTATNDDTALLDTFLYETSKHGVFPPQQLKRIFAHPDFVSLAQQLPAENEADISFQLDMEKKLANSASAEGGGVNGFHCGGDVCMGEINYDKDTDASAWILDTINTDKRVTTVILQPVVLYGRHEMRVILSISDKVQSIEL